jgi:photosystem II stability/assembly factor-like uncharacterized protein
MSTEPTFQLTSPFPPASVACEWRRRIGTSIGYAVGCLLVGGLALAFVGQRAAARPVLDDGVWVVQAAPTTVSLRGVHMLNSAEGWAVGDEGTILHFVGDHWELASSPVRTRLNGVDGVGSDDAWAVGESGTILHWNGVSWGQVDSPTTTRLTAIDMVAADDGWAVGQPSILHFDGAAWSTDVGAPAAVLSAVQMVDHDHGIAAGLRSLAQGAILKYDQGRWDLAPDSTRYLFTDVGVESASDYWLVGEAGELSPFGIIVRRGGAGSRSYETAHRLYGIALGPDKDWAVGEEGIILSHEKGGSWLEMVSPTKRWLLDVDVVGDGQAWAVGDSGTILHYALQTVVPTPTPPAQTLKPRAHLPFAASHGR